jgi:hypothetical protein
MIILCVSRRNAFDRTAPEGFWPAGFGDGTLWVDNGHFSATVFRDLR